MEELLIIIIITVIIALIALTIVITCCIKKYALNKETSEESLTNGIALLILMIIASSIFGMIYKVGAKNYTVVIYDHIYSVSLENGNKGGFFLGCGSVRSRCYYYFYTLTEKGYKLNEIEAENTYIIESEEIPHIELVKEYGQINPYNIIYVPVGTMVANYNVTK